MSWFDRFMTVGLGCAFIALCALVCAFIYTFQNPPRPQPSSTPNGLGVPSTMTPVTVTQTLTSLPPAVLPTLTPGLDDLIPTAAPNLGGDVPLKGQIVFTCFIAGFDEICTMNADGSQRRQLTDFGSTSFYASFSPDGDQIYFSSRKDGGYEIYSMNPSGRGVQRLTFNIGALYAPELSPDGDRIIFTNNGNGIWTMRADGNNPHALTFRDDIDPTWSSNGERIAFASSRTGTRQLYVMDKNGANIEQLTDLTNMGGRSSWSPNGQYIAFYRGPTGDHNIYIVNVETKEITRLTNGGDNLGPSWSFDGEWIAFTSFRDGNNEIYVMRPDGTGVRNLTNNPISDWQPRWGR
jgi:Tol biopolymer transport system component